MMFNKEWDVILKDEVKKDYFIKLEEFVREEYRTKTIYPEAKNVFNAFHYTDYNDVKVLILGQDPYHEPGEAHGLSFSVKPGVAIPPSLLNIYKKLEDELSLYIPNNGYLEKWAKQGVLMLNTVLTVRAHNANSHKGIGWEEFTDAAIMALNELDKPIGYMLWGSNARSKAKMLNNKKQLVLEAPHPSPLSSYRGFFGCNHFIKCNEFLKANGLSEIDWQIENI